MTISGRSTLNVRGPRRSIDSAIISKENDTRGLMALSRHRQVECQGPQVTSHLVAEMHRGGGKRENANAPRRKGVRKKRRGSGLKEKQAGRQSEMVRQDGRIV